MVPLAPTSRTRSPCPGRRRPKLPSACAHRRPAAASPPPRRVRGSPLNLRFQQPRARWSATCAPDAVNKGEWKDAITLDLKAYVTAPDKVGRPRTTQQSTTIRRRVDGATIHRRRRARRSTSQARPREIDGLVAVQRRRVRLVEQHSNRRARHAARSTTPCAP